VERDSFSRGLGFTGPGSGLASSPGLSLEIDLADAFFDTRVASRKLTAAREAESATSAQVMLKAAELYYNLLESRRMVELLEANNSFAGELAKVTNAFAMEGQGLLSDSQQASVYYIMLQSSLESAHLQYAQAGAQLARFLALDESADLRLRESSIIPLELYESLPAISRLINSALDKRPELREAEALREAAEEEHNMQMWSPLFPKVAAYYSDGEFEGGNEIDSDSSDRQGYSVAVFWELEGLGFKNYSNSGKKKSSLRQARTIESQIRADVAAEVKLAHDAVKHSKNQLDLLSKAVEQARQAYELTRERVFENKGMPMEAMQSMRMLEDAEKMMLRTVARYNLAQLQLLTVSGNSIDSQVIR
jgi:outer membrane protein TolC